MAVFMEESRSGDVAGRPSGRDTGKYVLLVSIVVVVTDSRYPCVLRIEMKYSSISTSYL